MSEKTETKTSKFSGLLSAVKERDPGEVRELEDMTTTRSNQVQEVQNPVVQPAGNLPRRGRPRGKRSDPDFEQVTAYIGRETYREVKIALLREGNGREFSELVEELLQKWLY